MDTDKALAYFNATWGDPACWVCQAQDWTLSEEMGYIGRLDADKKIDDTSALPVVAIACQRCGNVALMNAVAAGLVH